MERSFFLPVRRCAPVMAAFVCSVALAGCASTPSSSPKVPAKSTTTASTPTTAPTTQSTGATTTTTAPRVGFSPLSVTFASANTGWVLGTVPDGSGTKLAVVHTADSGRTWSKIPAPGVTFGTSDVGGPELIRFADPEDGWISTVVVTSQSGPYPSILWSTHDGGASWQQIPVPGDGNVSALGTSDGVFQMADMVTTGNGETISLYSAAAPTDTWVRAATSLPIGAGPVPYARLTLQGSGGWAMEIDRTVGAGARLTSGAWEAWTPPCSDANGGALLGASSTTDIVAVCDEGLWGPPPAGTTTGPWLFESSDGGRHFTAVGAIPKTEAIGDAYSVAMPPGEPEVVVVGGTGLGASFDGGRTWKTVYSASPGQVRVLGFTTASQGFAIVTGGTDASTLLMTHDGGATWASVDLSGVTTS